MCFFFIFRVLKLNCSFPKIYHENVTLSYESFSIFVCLFVLFFCLFFCFFFRLVCLLLFYFFCDKHYVLHRLQTKLINATPHCRHEKSRRGHLFHPFLTSNPVIPVYNFCRFKKKRKTTFHHLFLTALRLAWVLTKPSGKRLPTLFYSKIGLGTFCSPRMKIKYFFGFYLFSICSFQILNSLKTTF